MKLSEIFTAYHQEIVNWINDDNYIPYQDSPNCIYKEIMIKQGLNFGIIIIIDTNVFQVNTTINNIYVPAIKQIKENEHFEFNQNQYFGTDLENAKNIAIKSLMSIVNGEYA